MHVFFLANAHVAIDMKSIIVFFLKKFDCVHACVQVFSIFEDLGISVDCVATSEVSVSLTLDPSKLWSRELIQQVSI